ATIANRGFFIECNRRDRGLSKSKGFARSGEGRRNVSIASAPAGLECEHGAEDKGPEGTAFAPI
ncbi:MAG TPA: hypothetical protein VJH87_09600, partial [Vicinamibacteria bacterium]|nr:hypothetical protein [Vicinamibacteria bacterium]